MKNCIFFALIFVISACEFPESERNGRNSRSSGRLLPLVDVDVNVDRLVDNLRMNINSRILTWESNNYVNFDPNEMESLRSQMERLSEQLQSNVNGMQTNQSKLEEINRKLDEAEKKQKEILKGQIASYKQKIRELLETYNDELDEGDRKRRGKKECPCFQKAYNAMENAIKHYQEQSESIKAVVPNRTEEFQQNKEKVLKIGKEQMSNGNYRKCFGKYRNVL